MTADAYELAMTSASLLQWRQRDHGAAEDDVPQMDAHASAFPFFLRVLENAVRGRPAIGEVGYRAWIMASRHAPAVCPRSTRADLMEMRRLSALCIGCLEPGRIAAELAHDVFEFVLGTARTAPHIGKRVTVLAYGINTSETVRSALPSMESIGILWGLSAENKRSAVSAAARKILREVKDKSERRAAKHHNIISELWYAKRAVTREKYEAAQMGNGNRCASAEPDEDDEAREVELRREVALVRGGIPVRTEFARMDARSLKRRLSELHEQAELRRLAALG